MEFKDGNFMGPTMEEYRFEEAKGVYLSMNASIAKLHSVNYET